MDFSKGILNDNLYFRIIICDNYIINYSINAPSDG